MKYPCEERSHCWHRHTEFTAACCDCGRLGIIGPGIEVRDITWAQPGLALITIDYNTHFSAP